MTMSPDPVESGEDRTVIGCATVIGVGCVIIGAIGMYGWGGLISVGGLLLIMSAWRMVDRTSYVPTFVVGGIGLLLIIAARFLL